MAEVFNLLKRVRDLEVAPELSGYSGVRIYAGQDDEGNNIEYFSGNETGKVLEITNDWGSQAQADAICSKIIGYQYQPYTASGTQIDPSVELGDAVAISDVYGGVFSRRSIYGKSVLSDLSAPFYGEIEHEFQIQSPTNRQYDRFTKQVRSSLHITNNRILAEVEERKSAVEQLTAQLKVQAGLIEAKVSKTGGDSSSFGWKLDEMKHLWEANGKEVVRFDSSGAKITGEIIALRGSIGGFDILRNYLSYNGQIWGGTNTYGAYLGQNGFQLGRNFKVDISGHAVMKSADVQGTLRAGDLIYGGDSGYFDGAGLWDHSVGGGKVGYNTISTANTSGGINTSLGYANFSSDVFANRARASSMPCDFLSCNSFYFGQGNGGYVRWITKTIGGVTIHYLGRS